MQITDIHVKNYKSLLDCEINGLSAGFNVIVGKNNSGKTALVETLSLTSGLARHKSLKTIPSVGDLPKGESQVDIMVELSTGDVIDFLLTKEPLFVIFNASNIDTKLQLENVQQLFSLKTIAINFQYTNGSFVSAKLPGLELGTSGTNAYKFAINANTFANYEGLGQDFPA